LTPLARISTAVKYYQQKDVPLILVLPGDFLFPIDKIEYDYGKSMVQILNELSEYGIISLGNHEDIELSELNKRMQEFKYPIVASNFPSSVLSCLQSSVVLEMDDQPILGFIGLLSNSHNVVPKISFGGHPMENPFHIAKQLSEDFQHQNLDVIALTHMEIEEDRELAPQLDNLLAIFGGHDHEIILKEESPIYKCGVNGDAFCVLDFIWNDTLPSGKPTIRSQVKQSKDFAEDPRILEMINAVPLDNSVSSLLPALYPLFYYLRIF
jgi:2',3'-cyclic-nucleotide 2'-phosphodiesterase (5'-nucleotidase family)